MDAAALVADLLPRCAFPPAGTPVRCGFSGGADSLSLVVLARAAGCHVTAVHVDHGIRHESADEAELARHTAGRLAVDFELARLELADGSNLEARARAGRLAALGPGALTGHTADDRAETLLLNLVRGAGLDGLAAMGPSPTRPLVALRRTDTHALAGAVAADVQVAVVDDRSNRDPRFRRNRMRHEVIPLLDDVAGRDVTDLLVRTAALIGDDLAMLGELAAGIDATDARALAAAAPALARRAVRTWLTAGGYPPDASSVERVLAVARGEIVACELGGGRRVERHRQRLHLVDPPPVTWTDRMTTPHPDAG